MASTTIGTAYLNLMPSLRDFYSDVKSNLTQGMVEAGDEAGKEAGDAISSSIGKSLSNSNIGSSFSSLLSKAMPKIGDAVSALSPEIGAAMEAAMSNPVTAIIAAAILAVTMINKAIEAIGQAIADGEAKLADATVGAFSRGLSGAGSNLQTLGGYVSGIGGAFTSAGNLAMNFTNLVVNGLKGALSTAVQYGNQMIQAKISLEEMFGQGSTTDKLYQQIQKFAVTTPFDMPGVLQATKMIAAYGFQTSQVIPILTAAGDASAALGKGSAGVETFARALGQIQAKGYVSQLQLRQLYTMGINGVQMIADYTGKSTQEVTAMIKKGGIDANTAIAAIMQGTESKFGGMMDKVSLTAAGAWENIKDAWGMGLGTIAEAPLGEAGTAMSRIAGDLTPLMVNLGNAIKDAISPTMEKILNSLADSFDRLSKMPTDQLVGIVKSVLSLALVGPALLGVGKAFDFTGGLMQTFGGYAKDASSTVKNAESSFSSVFGEFTKGVFTLNPFKSFSTFTDLFTKGLAANVSSVSNLTFTFIGAIAAIGTALAAFASILLVAGTAVNMFSDVTGVTFGDILEQAKGWINTLDDTIQKMMPRIIRAASDAAQQIADGLPGIAESGVKLVADIASGISDMVPSLIKSINSVGDVFAKYAPKIIQSGMSVLLSLFTVFSQTAPQMFADVVTGLADGMSKAADLFAKQAPSIIQNLIRGLISSLPTILPKIDEIGNSIVKMLDTVFKTKSGNLTLIDGIVVFVSALAKSLGSNIAKIFNDKGVQKGISDMLNGVMYAIQAFASTGAGNAVMAAVVPPLFNVLGTLFIQFGLPILVKAMAATMALVALSLAAILPGVFWPLGVGIVTIVGDSIIGNKNGASDAMNKTMDEITNKISAAKIPAAANAAKMMDGVTGGINSKKNDPAIAMGDASNRAGAAAASGRGAARGNGGLLASSLSAGIKDKSGLSATAADSTAYAAVSRFNMSGAAHSSGAAIADGFSSGLSSRWNDVVKKAKGLLDAVRRLFPFSPAKEGPFSGRGWVTFSGLSIGQGLADGISASIPKVRSSALAMVDAANKDLMGVGGTGLSAQFAKSTAINPQYNQYVYNAAPDRSLTSEQELIKSLSTTKALLAKTGAF